MAFDKKKFDYIIDKVSKGSAVRNAVKEQHIASNTFFKWINSDEALQLQYARACEERGAYIYEDMIDIADDKSGDVQRDRLRVDTRKWFLSKLNPKKYSDKIQVDTTEFKEQPLFPDVPKDNSDK